MISEAKRQRLNANLPSGLFITKDGKLRLKKWFEGNLYQKQFGTYGEPGLVPAAEEFLAKLRQNARLKALNLPLPQEQMTLGQAVQLFWTKYASKKAGRLARSYRKLLDRILAYFGPDRAVDTITVEECREFREWCAKRVSKRSGTKVRPATVNRDHTALIALFHKLDRWQAEGTIPENVRLPKRNPAKYVPKAGEGETPIKPPTIEQFQNLLINASDSGMRRIILGAGVMMRRKKELMEMRKSANVNMTLGIIKGQVSKRKTEDEDRFYTVVITPTVRMLIDTAPSDFIFNFANFPKRWERTLRRAGYRVKDRIVERKGKRIQLWKNLVQFRALRKLGGTLLNLEKTDPRTIQEMYRHSSLEMTQIYVGAVPEAVRSAADRLDARLAWHQKVDDSVDYSPRFKTPKYQKALINQNV